jgi:hypothetical protein
LVDEKGGHHLAMNHPMHVINQCSARIDILAQKGTELINALVECAKGNFSNHLVVKSPKPHSVTLVYYGYAIRVRIEIRTGERAAAASLAAYAVSYQREPTETILCRFPYDTYGNVNGRSTISDFSPAFLSQVFLAALSRDDGMELRP